MVIEGKKMKSKTKTKISEQNIEIMIKAAFKNLRTIDNVSELNDGYFNSAYSVKLNGGEIKTVLKVSPTDDIDILTYEKKIMATEVEVLNLFANKLEIPAPRVLYSDFSRKRFPYDFYFMEFIEGNTWNNLRESLSDNENSLISTELGKITSKINSITSKSFGYKYNQFNTWKKAFNSMMEWLYSDFDRFNVKSTIKLDSIKKIIESNQKYLEEVKEAALVHWDLWDGNVFLSKIDGEYKISGIIDCERAFWGDPIAEANFADFSFNNDFYKGYDKDIYSTESSKIRRKLYSIYLFLVMIIESVPREYEDDGLTNWATEQLANIIKSFS